MSEDEQNQQKERLQLAIGFDAHTGIPPGGSNTHLRPYHSLLCSSCADQHIDFKITTKEYEKMKNLLAQLKPISNE